MLYVLALLLQAPDAKTVASHVHGLFVDGRWEGALKAYQRMPEPPPRPGLEDREASRVWTEYVQSRGEAQWEVAQCYARLGRWEEARGAFEAARTRWFRTSWCGNGLAAIALEVAVAEGLCLEHLGRHAEALELYFKALGNYGLVSVERPAARVVELYAAAGALEALEGRMARLDIPYRRRLEAREEDPGRRIEAMKWAPSAPLRPYFEAAREAPGPWRSRLPQEPRELPFPPIPKDFKLP